MNRQTQDLMGSINILKEFYENIPVLAKKFPESKEDLELLKSYVEYEIGKTIKDIIHFERL